MNNYSKITIQETGQSISLSEFFRAFGYADDDTIYIRTFDDKKKNGKLASKKHIKLSVFDEIIPELVDLNQSGCGVFFVVNGGGDTNEEVIKGNIARAQFFECDDKSLEEQWQIIEDAPLEPSIIVQTSKSLHVYYLLIDGQAARFRGLQNKLCEFCGGDTSVKNEGRVMRLPGFYHNKQEPVIVKLVRFKPELKYTQDQILAAFSSSAAHESKAAAPTVIEKAGASPELITAESVEKIGEGNRHDFIYKTSCKLIEAGLMREAVLDALLRENRTRFTEPLAESEINYILDCAYRYKTTPDERRQWREDNGFPLADVQEQQCDWRDGFHKWTKPDKDGRCYPRDTIDDRIVEDIIKRNNMFRLFGKIYIQDQEVPSYFKMDDDETLLRSMISKYIHEDLLTSTRINRIYNLFDSKPQLRVEEDDVNRCPKSWIVFRNGILDARTMEWHEHDSKYRCINLIPHDYDSDYVIPEDSIVKQFLEQLIPAEDDRRMFLEYCGYCATFDTSQQKLMMLRGQGGVGKSVMLRLQKRFIGDKNCSGLTLQNLNDRFSPAFLFGKLINIYADTPSTDMDEINGIKTITGEDTIRAEYKGGDVFFFNPYCKLLYSTNRVPKSRDDKTNAYYRRLLILPIDKRAETFRNLEERLADDVETFIHLCVNAVHQMYERGYILESAASKKEVLELYMATDSVKAFLHDRTERAADSRIERTTLYQMYCDYCDEEGRERYQLSRNGFYQNLRDKGFGEISGRPEKYFVGLQMIPEGFEQIKVDDIPF